MHKLQHAILCTTATTLGACALEPITLETGTEAQPAHQQIAVTEPEAFMIEQCQRLPERHIIRCWR